MNATINLGAPNKNTAAIAEKVLGTYSTRILKITGVTVFQGCNLLLTSSCYGAGMTLDCLEELRQIGLLTQGDATILVGSMGALTSNIRLGDIVLPEPVLCAYYGYRGQELHQDGALMGNLSAQLAKAGLTAKAYRHGSSFAVFDPHTDHSTYTHSAYNSTVDGVDCGEVFIGLQFARQNNLRAGAVLYCSDNPTTHIADIGERQFADLADQKDLALNQVAVTVLRPST